MDIRRDQLNRNAVSTLCLHRGMTARLEDARGKRLRVESGGVWITHDRCHDDVVVNAGETYTVDRDGPTVVASLGRDVALVTIESPAPARTKPSFADRLGSFVRGLHLQATPAPRG